MDSTNIQKFLNNAPEIITRNVAYLFKNSIPGCTPIELKYFKLISNLSQSIPDQELALVFMSLLIHASKYELQTFRSFVDDIDRGKYGRPDTADLPSQEVEEGALKILNKDAIIHVLIQILNANVTSQEYTELHTKQQLQKCKIVYVDFTTSYQIIKGWVTPIGVAINVGALSKRQFATLTHPVAFAALLGHQIQHYLHRDAVNNFIMSTPEAVKNNSNQADKEFKSTLPNNLESGLLFEFKAFGAKFDYYTTAQPMLKIMEERLREEPLILPIISEDEKQNNPSVKTYVSKNFNVRFCFELGGNGRVFE